MMNRHPLVSIPVITYNSSSYIIEGLESIKAQTYKNIELVISDDCSTDNTVEICQKWLEANKQYFKRTVLVTTEKNTGVAGNLNRAIKECHGEWIKPLSGDDKFFPYTIEGYMKFIQVYPDCNIAFAKLKMFGDNTEENIRISKEYEESYYKKIKYLDTESLRKNNLKRLCIPGPGLIYRKSLWTKVSGFDEEYQFCEEETFMHTILGINEKIYFIDEELYQYRITTDSLCREQRNTGISRHNKDKFKFFRSVKRKELLRERMFYSAYEETLRIKHIEAYSKNKKLLAAIYIIMSPQQIRMRIKKSILQKSHRNC